MKIYGASISPDYEVSSKSVVSKGSYCLGARHKYKTIDKFEHETKILNNQTSGT